MKGIIMGIEEGHADQSDTGGNETGSTNQEQEPRTFTQDEVNALITERLKRERSRFDKQSQESAEQARLATLGESERAIETARAEAKAEAKREHAIELAAAQIRAELTGLVDDPSSVVEDLNLSRFVSEDSTVDDEAVKGLKAKYQSLLDGRKRGGSRNLQPGRADSVSTRTPKEDFATLFGL